MSVDEENLSTIQCTGCTERLHRHEVQWLPLRAADTGLYFPGEPFCGRECYQKYVDQPEGNFRMPTQEQREAFIRSVLPVM